MRCPTCAFSDLKFDAQDGRIVSPGHLARQGKPIAYARLKQLEDDGKTVVALVRDDEPRALFALADIVRPESKEAIAELSRLGITSVMLTGDAREIGRASCRERVCQYV